MDKVMLVGSNLQSIELMNKYLTQSGFTVFTADTGASALAKAQLFTPDLIILETDLSDMSGYDVCKKIKNNPAIKLILVALLSNLDSREQSIKAIQSEADDFLDKTVDVTMFVAKVRSMLRIKHLGTELQNKYAELQEKDRLLEYELKIAMQVQRSLIQEVDCTLHGVHIVSKYMPAMYIGGDFYDTTIIDDHRVAVIMGDVAGHGISAALLTSMLTHMTKSLVPFHVEPNALLAKMNNDFCNTFKNGISDIYATMFYALFDMRDKTVTYANAGHPFPYHISASLGTATELKTSGIPIGLIENSTYKNVTFAFGEGDMLFLQTDGLSDVYYKEKPEEYSQKIRQLLLELKNTPPKELIESLIGMYYKFDLTESEKFTADDVTIIMCINQGADAAPST